MHLHLAGFTRLLATILFALMISWSVAAQETPVVEADLEAAYDKAFQELFRDPGNLDKSYRFAVLAIRKGNFEAAISALERMLLIEPDLPRVRFELGALYFNIGSFAIARSYLTSVLESPDAPQEVLDRVQVYLAEINSQLSRSNLSSSVFLGARYSNNANSGPSSSNVLANGVAATLGDEFTDKSDRNYFVSAQFNHSYDLLTQRSEVIESSGTLYVSEQDRQKQLDIVLLEVKSGIRGPFFQTAVPGTTMMPYMLGNMLYLQDSWYQFSIGLGANIVVPFTQRLSATVNIEHKSEHFRNDSNRLTASQQTGVENSLRGNAAYALTQTQQVAFRISATSQAAKETFNAFREYAAGATFTQLLAIKTLDSRFASFTASIGRKMSKYNSPNPTVEANRKRQDQAWDWSVTSTVPATENWTIITTFQRSTINSNLPNFKNQSNAITLGASRAF
jgi:tetratricopeptide (TPR) repeat protein